MLRALLSFISILVTVFKLRCDLALENLALRQQLAVYQRRHPRPQLYPRDRVFWVWLSKVWGQWRSALVIIKPETVIRWHREGFKFFWTRSAQGKQAGRQSVTAQVKALLKQVAQANLIWGVPRIYGNLFQLGIDLENKPLFQQSSASPNASLRRKGAYSNYR